MLDFRLATDRQNLTLGRLLPLSLLLALLLILIWLFVGRGCRRFMNAP
jgi:hypothetical protein